jgi:hypothetical protein
MQTMKTMLHLEGNSLDKTIRPIQKTSIGKILPTIGPDKPGSHTAIFEHYKSVPLDTQLPPVIIPSVLPENIRSSSERSDGELACEQRSSNSGSCSNSIKSHLRQNSRNSFSQENLEDAISELQDQSVAIYDEIKKLSFILHALNSKVTYLQTIIERN